MAFIKQPRPVLVVKKVAREIKKYLKKQNIYNYDVP
jgi:hypothetical protein